MISKLFAYLTQYILVRRRGDLPNRSKLLDEPDGLPLQCTTWFIHIRWNVPKALSWACRRVSCKTRLNITNLRDS